MAEDKIAKVHQWKPDCILFNNKLNDELHEIIVALTSSSPRKSTEEYQRIQKYTSQQSIPVAKLHI